MIFIYRGYDERLMRIAVYPFSVLVDGVFEHFDRQAHPFDAEARGQSVAQIAVSQFPRYICRIVGRYRNVKQRLVRQFLGGSSRQLRYRTQVVYRRKIRILVFKNYAHRSEPR